MRRRPSGNVLVPYFIVDSAPFQRTRIVTDGVAQAMTNPALGGSEAGVYGNDVNEGGLAVGFVVDLDGAPASPFAFQWQNGTTTLLDRGGVQASWAGAVHDHGVIAGGVRDGRLNLRPVIWWNGTRIALCGWTASRITSTTPTWCWGSSSLASTGRSRGTRACWRIDVHRCRSARRCT